MDNGMNRWELTGALTFVIGAILLWVALGFIIGVNYARG